MADWTHCNICVRQPSTECAFFLTGCGHILCKKCVDNGAANPVCKVCNQKSGLLEINRHLRTDLQDFFKDPKDLLSQYQSKLLNKVFEFQSGHRKRLMKHYQETQHKAMKMAQFFQGEMKKKAEAERQNKILKEEHKRVQEEHRRLQEEARMYKNQNAANAEQHRHRSAHVPHYRSRSPATNPRTPQHPLLMSFDSDSGTQMGSNASISSLATRMNTAISSNGKASVQDQFRKSQSSQQQANSPLITTPIMLGMGGGSANTSADGGNPYLHMWNGQQQRPMTPNSASRSRTDTSSSASRRRMSQTASPSLGFSFNSAMGHS